MAAQCPACKAFPGQTRRPPQVGNNTATSCFDDWHFPPPTDTTIREEIAS